ncbi:hypothetical protein MJ559_26630 [Klebsiella pneumoniae]|nr:hypothetical protein MJ559_26630 [Klebsiella pneumoniae]
MLEVEGVCRSPQRVGYPRYLQPSEIPAGGR